MMKRSEIIAECRALKEATANVRGWLDHIDARADAMIGGLSTPTEQPFVVQPTDGRDEWPPPRQIEYDETQFDAPPRPVQPTLEPGPEVFCNCGDHAKRIEKVGKNNKPYVAYACPNPKEEGCQFWVFENQLQKA